MALTRQAGSMLGTQAAPRARIQTPREPPQPEPGPLTSRTRYQGSGSTPSALLTFYRQVALSPLPHSTRAAGCHRQSPAARQACFVRPFKRPRSERDPGPVDTTIECSSRPSAVVVHARLDPAASSEDSDSHACMPMASTSTSTCAVCPCNVAQDTRNFARTACMYQASQP